MSKNGLKRNRGACRWGEHVTQKFRSKLLTCPPLVRLRNRFPCVGKDGVASKTKLKLVTHLRPGDGSSSGPGCQRSGHVFLIYGSINSGMAWRATTGR